MPDLPEPPLVTGGKSTVSAGSPLYDLQAIDKAMRQAVEEDPEFDPEFDGGSDFGGPSEAAWPSARKTCNTISECSTGSAGSDDSGSGNK